MSSARIRQRNNTLAGLFVLLSILAFIVVTIILSGFQGWGDAREVLIRFPMDLGVPGLEIGSDVAVGMTNVGQVQWIEIRSDVPPGDEAHILVAVTLPESYVVRQGAKAGLVVPLIGSGTIINFDTLGSGEPLPEGAVVPGDIAAPIFLRSAGIGPKQVEQIKVVLSRVEAISADVETVTDTLARLATEEEGGIQASVADARAAIADVRAMIAAVRERWPGWLESVDVVMERSRHLGERMEDLLVQARANIDNMGAGIEEVRTLIGETSPEIRRAIANVADVTERAKTTIVPQVEQVLARGDRTLADVHSAVEMLDERLTTELPQISQILANLRLASNNLKLATVEIRAAPWKLLYKPSADEIEDSRLYDAVRTYAAAVGELNAAADSLRALQSRYSDEELAESGVLYEALGQIDESLANYREAERLWYELLLEEAR